MSHVRQCSEEESCRWRRWGIQLRRAQPPHWPEAAPVGWWCGDVRTGTEALQVEVVGVIPAHSVKKLVQFGRRVGSDEELGTSVWGRCHWADRDAHALKSYQRPLPGRLGNFNHVEGTADR
jgi:hypothetical protein